MVNILIADDNTHFLKYLFNSIIRGNENLKIVDITTDGLSTYNSILELKPDIVILDLNMPKMDGIEVITKIQKEDINSRIIIVSGYSDYIYKISNKENIDFIFSKTKDLSLLTNYVNRLAIDLEEDVYRQNIITIFKDLKFNMSASGTQYLIKAILEANKNEKLLLKMENSLYSLVATQFNTTNQKVKWNINRAIKSMWRYTEDRTYISKTYGKENKSCPTAKDIITNCIETLKK